MWVMGGSGGPLGAAPGGGAAAGFAGSAGDPVFCAKVVLVASPAATAAVDLRNVRRSSDPMVTSSQCEQLASSCGGELKSALAGSRSLRGGPNPFWSSSPPELPCLKLIGSRRGSQPAAQVINGHSLRMSGPDGRLGGRCPTDLPGGLSQALSHGL